MGKVDENKKKKKEALFNTAYELFTTKGINATAISDIVEKAGVAKGTFYLYFKDKYDIKNKLTAFKTHELFEKAAKALRKADISGLEEQLIFIIDYIIDALASNKALLNFISKNLVMGALRSALLTEERTEPDFYEEFLNLVNEDSYKYECPDVKNAIETLPDSVQVFLTYSNTIIFHFTDNLVIFDLQDNMDMSICFSVIDGIGY